MLDAILNFASACFFVASLFSIKRKWASRAKMDSTSLEGTVIHTIGNCGVVCVSVFVGAWISVVTELFLACLGGLTVYWKVKWLRCC